MRVPSLVLNWPSEGALCAGLKNGSETIYAGESECVSRHFGVHGLHGVNAVSPILYSLYKIPSGTQSSRVNTK